MISGLRFATSLVCMLGPGLHSEAGTDRLTGPTKPFEVRDGRAFLGGKPVKLWGLRCGNALMDRAMAERCVHYLDTMAAHGINLVAVHLQAANGGNPNIQAGANAFGETGGLKPAFARPAGMARPRGRQPGGWSSSSASSQP